MTDQGADPEEYTPYSAESSEESAEENVASGSYDSYTEDQYEETYDSEEDYDDESYDEDEQAYPEPYGEIAGMAVLQSSMQSPLQSSPENLRADDTDADADVVRPQRAAQYRAQRRSHFSMAIPALLMILVGALYLADLLTPETQELTTPMMIGVAIGGLALALIARFLINTRSERGLLFMGLLVTLMSGFIALNVFRIFDINRSWPLSISVIGVAMLGMVFFEKNHEQKLLFPALILLVAGVAALPFTMGMFPVEVLGAVAVYWPLLFLFLGVALLPRVLRMS